MKIGLILPGFSAAESEWCIPALLDLARQLSRQVELHVFPLRYPYRREAYSVYGARVHPLGGATAGGARRAALLARGIGAIVAEHQRAPFDLLHAFWADEPGFVAVIAAALLRRPALVSLAGGELVGFPDIRYGGQLRWSSRWLTRLSLRFATEVTAGSTYLSRLAEKSVDPARLSLLPLGVDTDLFTPAPLPGTLLPFDRSRLNLLTVGSLVPVKRQEDLLVALPRVIAVAPDAQLHLVGDGPLIGQLKALAASLGISAQVTFHGAVGHELLPTHYRAADLFVLPSRYEAQGLVALEAAACGLPVAGSAVGILPDLGSAALTAPPGDVRALADALTALATDGEARAELGLGALHIVRTEYSLERMAGGLLDRYRRLMAGTRSARRAGRDPAR